jgi:hypothetical protein
VRAFGTFVQLFVQLFVLDFWYIVGRWVRFTLVPYFTDKKKIPPAFWLCEAIKRSKNIFI